LPLLLFQNATYKKPGLLQDGVFKFGSGKPIFELVDTQTLGKVALYQLSYFPLDVVRKLLPDNRISALYGLFLSGGSTSRYGEIFST